MSFRSAFQQAAWPAAGFIVGWGSWTLAEQSGVMPPAIPDYLYLARLRLQRAVRANAPPSIAQTLNMPTTESIEAMISAVETHIAEQRAASQGGGEKKASESDRVPFLDVLRQCRVQEQLEWLEEHAQEEIPYFFIADIFHDFARMHEAQALTIVPPPPTSPTGENGKSDEGKKKAGGSLHQHDGDNSLPSKDCYQAKLRHDSRFGSAVLCERVMVMMANGVLPFDVSSRVLSVLAVNNKENAARIAAWKQTKTKTVPQQEEKDSTMAAALPTISVTRTFLDVFLSKYDVYKQQLEEAGTPEGDAVVRAELVDVAALQLLRACETAQVRGRPWYAPWRAPTGSHPLLQSTLVKSIQHNGGETPPSLGSDLHWRAACAVLQTGRTRPVGDAAVFYADNAAAFLQCPLTENV